MRRLRDSVMEKQGAIGASPTCSILPRPPKIIRSILVRIMSIRRDFLLLRFELLQHRPNSDCRANRKYAKPRRRKRAFFAQISCRAPCNVAQLACSRLCQFRHRSPPGANDVQTTYPAGRLVPRGQNSLAPQCLRSERLSACSSLPRASQRGGMGADVGEGASGSKTTVVNFRSASSSRM